MKHLLALICLVPCIYFVDGTAEPTPESGYGSGLEEDECCPIKKIWGSPYPKDNGVYYLIGTGRVAPECNSPCLYEKKGKEMDGKTYCFADSTYSQSKCLRDNYGSSTEESLYSKSTTMMTDNIEYTTTETESKPVGPQELGDRCDPDASEPQCPNPAGGSTCTPDGDGNAFCLVSFCLPLGAVWTYEGKTLGKCCEGTKADIESGKCEADEKEERAGLGEVCKSNEDCATGTECQGYSPKVCKIPRKTKIGEWEVSICLPTGFINWSESHPSTNKAIGRCCKFGALSKEKRCP